MPEDAGILSMMEMYPLICQKHILLENTVAAISAMPKNGYRFVNGPQIILIFNQTRNKKEHSLLFLKALHRYFEEIFDVYVPNSFTPNNGDYDNNVFQVSVFTENEYIFNIKIFNRWGQFVNESIDALNAWDGTNAKTGTQVADGVYTYILNIVIPSSDINYETKGSITIVR